MISELETLFTRLERMRMTPADRELARARLEQAEAFADALHAAATALRRVFARAGHTPHHTDLRPTA